MRSWTVLFVILVLGTAASGCDQKAAAGRAEPGTRTVVPGVAGGSHLQLPVQSARKNPIRTARVGLARLSPDLDVVGSVAASEDHVATVGPLVSGRIARLLAGVGAVVRKNQILGEIESAEVGEAQAAYLMARARAEAAAANLRRETDLAAKRISPERDREKAVAESEIERAGLQAAFERLSAMGLAPSDIESIGKGAGIAGRLPVRAPISGTVIERFVTLGQAVERATDAFRIADLRTLWVMLDVYEKDLAKVHLDQKVEIRTEAYRQDIFKGHVAYVGQVIDGSTRTAKVRIEIANDGAKLRFGQLVTARILGDTASAGAEVPVVPRSAIQAVEGTTVVFVRNKDGFARRLVELGVSGGDAIEIRQGLQLDEEVATDGAFLLKSELLR